ncbi:unnamed protein product [Vicia faba]|uniref:Cytochrome P450 n=1 Tax=Vicia faba TaxID=3906 RepID=A0AAV0ZK32_VICFA|nr:unnamed protein product [Vicia faba]
MKHPIELLKEMKKVSFEVTVNIFMGSSNRNIVKSFRSSFTVLSNGMFSLPINAPGFTFNKARNKIAKILQPVVDERRLMIKNGQQVGEKKDLIDILLEVKDANGRNLEDVDISDLFIGLLFTGYETTATALQSIHIF